jgi:hypothetical protein
VKSLHVDVLLGVVLGIVVAAPLVMLQLMWAIR